jgi:hypothetical protein
VDDITGSEGEDFEFEAGSEGNLLKQNWQNSLRKKV